MQLGGRPVKVKLRVDLTKYDSRCTEGQEGTTLPNVKMSTWGSFDTFVAVKFDNGAVMDIAINSLEFLDETIVEAQTT